MIMLTILSRGKGLFSRLLRLAPVLLGAAAMVAAGFFATVAEAQERVPRRNVLQRLFGVFTPQRRVYYEDQYDLRRQPRPQRIQKRRAQPSDRKSVV